MAADWKPPAAFFCFLLSTSNALAGDIVPSFDCSRAEAPDEQQICRDGRLAELDQATTLAFKQALKAGPQKYAPELTEKVQHDVRAAVRDKLGDRHACGSSPICILDTQVLAVSYLNEVGADIPVPSWVGEYRLEYANQHPELVDSNMPKSLGHCTRTKITAIAGRFGETLKWPLSKDETVSGTTVQYANGAYQISYNYEEAVARSHTGDEVLICLSTIPKHCPSGDDRGRVYSATVLATNRSWIMPDSQHMCGGP
jgi:uncharacterized protein